jgi:hypothetical protein
MVNLVDIQDNSMEELPFNRERIHDNQSDEKFYDAYPWAEWIW